MKRWHWVVSGAIALAAVASAAEAQTGANKPSFSGSWNLSLNLSDNPQQIGFDQGQGRGGNKQAAQDSEEDRARIQELTDEVKYPSSRLIISQTDVDLTITDAMDHARVFPFDGRKAMQQLQAGTVESTTKWDGNKLITEYDLGKGRKVRHTYSLPANAKQLLEQVTFEGGERSAAPIKRVYDAAASQVDAGR